MIAPLAGAAAIDTDAAAPFAAALALATAAVYLALGALRMGWVSTFLSNAMMTRTAPHTHADAPTQR